MLKKFLIVSLIFFAACTSEQRLKKLALAEANSMAKASYQDEARARFSSRELMMQKYSQTLLDQAEFEVTEVKEQEQSAFVNVEVRSVPESVRSAMIAIIATHDEAKDKNLNIPDALQMIRKQQSLVPGAFEKKVFTIRFEKDVKATEGWKLK